MSTFKQWQLMLEAAQRYEHILVPAILGPFARALVDWANLPPGAVVLDVGCGTGAAARFAARHVGPAGRVIGVDINAGMIQVAQSLPPDGGAPIDWYQQSALDLPLADRTVDVALCAQTLQFLDDRRRALTEMYRVLKLGGRIALSLWCDIQHNPYFDALVAAISQHVGSDTAAGLGAAFALTDAGETVSLLQCAGFGAVEIAEIQLELGLPPLETFVPRHISATPMGIGYAAASLTAQQAVVDDLLAGLAQFKQADGVRVPFRSYMVVGFRRTREGPAALCDGPGKRRFQCPGTHCHGQGKK